ncbi:MAG: plastocyanin/azurin family copper-binding protein [Verrucomicrobiota bacterium]
MKTTAQCITALFALALGAGPAFPAAPPAATPPAAPVVVEITVNDAAMKFSMAKIQAHPGQTLTIRLKNNGTQPKDVMGHNWVLLKGGTDMDSYAAAAAIAKPEGYQPKALADQVLAAIPLLGPKQSGEVTFTCPTAPGNYDYLCTFPAHAMAGMKGVLTVK